MSNEVANWEKQLAVYEQTNRALMGESVPKKTVGVLTLWFGKQMYDDSDYDAFMDASSYMLRGIHLANFHFPDADGIEDITTYRPLADDLARELDRLTCPLAVFIIATPEVAELRHISHLPAGILGYRIGHGAHPTFVYKIIFGYSFSNRTYQSTDPHFDEVELKSRELGGIFVPFNGDYPSVAGRRLCGIMTRLLGHDLPGEQFPNYTPEEVEKIAWHARREDFNAHFPREGAIPKYPIVDGRPQFPF